MAARKSTSLPNDKESHEVLLKVMDSIDAAIYVSSLEKHEILYMNKFMKDQFGDQMKGNICHVAFRNEEKPCAHCSNHLLINEFGESAGVHVWDTKNPLNNKWYRNHNKAIKWVDGSWVRLQIAIDLGNSAEIDMNLHRRHDDLENLVAERTEKLYQANVELNVEIAERNKAKKALIESERLLNRAQEISNTGDFRYDFLTKKLSWSNQYYRILGLKPGKPPAPDHALFLSRIHPEDRENINHLLKTRDGFKAINLNFEFRTIPINGSIHTIRAYSEVEYSDSGEPLWMQGVNQDITEQRNAQVKLAKSESMYRTLVNNISEGLIITNKDSEIKFVNPRFSDITGYEKEEILNHTTEIFFDKENRKKIKTFFLQTLKGRPSSLELKITRKDKVKLPVLISGNPIMEEDGFNGVFIVMTNISHIRKAEQEVHESIQNLNRAQKISHTGSWDWDSRTEQSNWSDEMYRILGYQPQQPKNVIGATFFNKVHPRDREAVHQFIEEGWKNGVPFNYEYRTIPINGKIKTIRCFVEIDYDETDKPIRLIGIDQDITEYRQNEKALKKAKIQAEASNEAKTNFLANMSHELRTPMQGILGFSKLCLTRLNSLKKPKIKEYLEDVYSSALRLMALLNDLLDLSKLEAEKHQYEFFKENLIRLVQEKIVYQRLSAEEKLLTIHFDTKKSKIKIEMDAAKIGQVIENLLSNAIRYSEGATQKSCKESKIGLDSAGTGV